MILAALLNSGLVVIGLLLLYYGGDFLVAGAAAIAATLRISALVVGLTVVAFGTSAPELFVSVVSAVQGLMAISVGNVIGSNIINIALILGLAAVIHPVEISPRLIRRDIPVMVLTLVVFGLVIVDFSGEGSLLAGGVVHLWEGLVMVALLIAYVVFLVFSSKRHVRQPLAVAVQAPTMSMPIAVLKTIGGIVALAGGAQVLVQGASWLAQNVFGASERFVGLTIVALGTSLPELVTSLVAASRNEMDISVGNIVGSNIFNSLFVLGLVAIVRPVAVGATGFSVDFGVMLLVSLFLLVVALVRKRLERWSGALLMTIYVAHFGFLLLTRGAL